MKPALGEHSLRGLEDRVTEQGARFVTARRRSGGSSCGSNAHFMNIDSSGDEAPEPFVPAAIPGARVGAPMDHRLVAAALPLFFALIALEILLSRRQAEPRYRFPDSITNLSCGVGQQVLEPFLRAAGLAAYFFVYAHWRVTRIPVSSVAGWVVLVAAVDFFYYVFHRASHRVNLFWASHVVHHQSEEYNLSVALRQSWIEILLQGIFYLPLALAGFAPLAFVTVSTLNTLYQFWIHTRLVARLPAWIEWFINTPSHHRVHHGVNPKYIDKNYAGIFIIWDRMLGTFQEEQEEPVYGTVKPLASFSPLWANAHYWVEMAAMSRSAPRLADKLRVWVAPPEWRPRELSNGLGYVTIPEASRATQTKYDVPVGRALLVYVAVQFAIVASVTSAITVFGERIPFAMMAAATALVLVEVVAWGALFEAKAWGAPLAMVRLVATAVVVAWFARDMAMGMVLTIGVAVAMLAMCAWVARVRVAAVARAQRPGGAIDGVAAP
jgi:alkylglycerol monooxygenase